MAGMVLACSSGRNGEFSRRVMEREDLVDVVHVAFAAARAEAVVDAVLGEEGVEIGNVGLFGVGEAEQLPSANQVGAAPATAEQAVVADVVEARRQDMLEEAVDERRGG